MNKSDGPETVGRPSILKPVARNYDRALKHFGPKHKAVAWRDQERQ